jgi:23S rRNA pseudouridine2605 synthase
MRLNRYLAQAGVASRRRADSLIEGGKVAINGQIITNLGTQVDETKDIVEVDGKPIKPVDDNVYILLNKPVSYLVTCDDQFNRPIVLDLVGKYRNLVKPVGRLDLNSSGLLLLTNDGELAFRLTHPRFKIDKTYQVKCEGLLSDAEINRLETGIELDDGITAPAKVELQSRTENFSRFKITIHEGRKRQVRIMCLVLGHRVISLKRLVFGNLSLDDLKEGKYRLLTENEIKELKASVKL